MSPFWIMICINRHTPRLFKLSHSVWVKWTRLYLELSHRDLFPNFPSRQWTVTVTVHLYTRPSCPTGALCLRNAVTVMFGLRKDTASSAQPGLWQILRWNSWFLWFISQGKSLLHQRDGMICQGPALGNGSYLRFLWEGPKTGCI